MIRQSLQDLILACMRIKKAYTATSYELHDYDDGDYADFRLLKVNSIEELANLTKGHQVSIFADNGQTIVRIYENYQGE